MDIEPLIYFMHERQTIFLKKRAGAKWPWTNDPILREYRFCNVFREQDTVTEWIENNIRLPYADHEHLWFMLCIARQINWPETLQELIYSPDAWPSDERFCPERMTCVLDSRKASGDKVYTGAYMIRAESDPKKEWYKWTKQRYMAEIVLGRVWEKRQEFEAQFNPFLPSRPGTEHQPALQDIHEWLMQFHGWGPFMSYEVVTDLRHTRYLDNAPDIMTWANAGPGAFRGLNRLIGSPKDAPMSQAVACHHMRELLAAMTEEFPSWELEMRDIEHCLCEVDKYLRVKRGEGRPRAKYVLGRGW